jgi:predicted  nucleic acid-binding Zn-ribbon protein
MAKITEEQLKKVNKGQEKLMSLVNQIGVLESQKHGLLHQVADVNKEVEEFKAELEEEYGPVNIDLKTGEYKTIEEDAKLEKA